MLRLKAATRFKKDLKKFNHNKTVQKKLEEIIKLLITEKSLPEKNHDHPLVGNYKEHRECHITPDVLLIYKIDSSINLLSLEPVFKFKWPLD